MWPAEQALMLALHRRAFSHAMAYDQESALNDYHKLQDHIRGASRRVRGSATPPRGAKTFLAALDALAEYHVGELYRSDHAHACALRRFIGGLRRMERIIELGEIEDPQALLDNSAWRVRLMVSMGKARYEMGSPRRALEWYLKAWRALLVLQSTKKVFGLSADELDDALEWLDATREDPDLDKDEVLEHLEPCVEEIAVTWVAQQLRALAAEVLLRLGHVLMVIRIGERQPHPPRTPRPGDLHGLAHRCLRAAASHDPGLTLVWTDLLRLQLDGGTDRVLQPIEPTFEEQWPLGGDPEQAIRIIEFLMLLALDDASSADSEGCATVARSLLSDFMHHTDSANVKASQADKLLHKVPKPNRHLPRPSLEFVCLRRYSCSFLPRPASFRPLGGGYLVRVHLPGHELPYGIAIDPGPDFVETLYRCHHCLHDIHALIVTHDHADHLASLDALIKLFDRQGRLKLVDPADRPQRFKPEDWRRPPRSEGPDPVVILGSTSVRRRYEGTSVAVGDLLASGELLAALGIPVTLQAYKNRRHLDLGGEPACGLKITLKSGSGSIAFTSDMALEDKLPHDDVLAADVVVTHMGGAPVRELRGLANLDSDVPEGFGDTWDLLSDSLRERLRRVLGLGDDEEPLGPVAPLVRPNRPPMLEGLFDLAQTMASRSMERGARQLLVIGELAEELGTFRAKVAARISESVMDDSSCRALTADVGLRIIIGGWPSDGTSIARILCSTCALDNDRTLEERFHAAPDMREVCVRGENEGIFYNCEPHDPGATSRFVERLDRYDIFGR
jgi:hypothetical protein